MDCGNLIDAVSIELNDADHVRWTVHTLFDYLNAGVLEVARSVPDAATETRVMRLAQGSEQNVDAIQFLRAVRNVPSGIAVRAISTASLDALLPAWSASERATNVREYAPDPVVRTKFWVYPPASAASMLEVEVIGRPDVVSAPTNMANPVVWPPFPLPDRCYEAVRNYMLYRAYALDTGAGSESKSQACLTRMYLSMGVTHGNEENK